MTTLLIRPWISAIRLRTLPLALASIGMGSFLAAYEGVFKFSIFLFSSLTTVFLQILSNLANDYGDFQHGADHDLRKGPLRMVQSGLIKPSSMRFAIIVLVLLSLGSGIFLLYLAFGWSMEIFFTFFLLGILAIIAAMSYTMGKRPYGYQGFGDVSVLIFFGFVGVLGTYYLHSGKLPAMHILPAMSCGLFSIGVLNLNNIRDIDSDKMAGKKSIAVRLGRKKAIRYHEMLLAGGIISALVFASVEVKQWPAFLFLITIPLFYKNIIAVKTKKTPEELDPYLRQMALSTLIFVLLFGLGLLFST